MLDTYVAVVAAADCLGVARAAAADAYNRDGGAVESQVDIHILQHDAKEPQEGSARRRVRLRGTPE